MFGVHSNFLCTSHFHTDINIWILSVANLFNVFYNSLDDFGDICELLVVDLIVLSPTSFTFFWTSVTNISMTSPASQWCHQHPNDVTNINDQISLTQSIIILWSNILKRCLNDGKTRRKIGNSFSNFIDFFFQISPYFSSNLLSIQSYRHIYISE